MTDTPPTPPGDQSVPPVPPIVPPVPPVPPIVPPVAPMVTPPAAATPVPPVSPAAAPPPPGPFSVPGGAPAGAAAAAPGWVPPPKPGLIPLRPLTLGTVLGASFQVLRRNPRPMFGFSLLITAAVSLLSVVVIGVVSVLVIGRVESASAEDADTVTAGAIGIFLLAALIPIAISLILGAILQGVISLEVARGTVGERLTLAGLWRGIRGRIGALIGWTLLATVVASVAVAIAVAIIVLIGAVGGVAGAVIAVLLGIALVFGVIVVGAWLGVKLSFVPSVLVVERAPLRRAVGRAWRLTNGFFWRTLGIELLVIVIVGIAQNIVTAPFQLVFTFGTTLLNPNGDPGAAGAFFLITGILTIAVTTVLGAIAAVVQSSAITLLYIDLRMRKEGLDLELARFVEARQAGATEVADPYLATPAEAR